MFPGMMPMSGDSSSTTGTSGGEVGGGANNGLDFSSLLNQFQAANVSSPPIPSPTPITPEQRFERQLNSLNDMGFTDREANIRALTECDGNVNRAVERLLSG